MRACERAEAVSSQDQPAMTDERQALIYEAKHRMGGIRVLAWKLATKNPRPSRRAKMQAAYNRRVNGLAALVAAHPWLADLPRPPMN